MNQKAGPVGRPPSPKAAYRQLAERLSARMAAGEWLPGQNLPSIRQLAQSFNVGQQVVRLALKYLSAQQALYIGSDGRYSVGAVGRQVAALSGAVGLVFSHSLDIHWGNPEEVALRQGIEMALGPHGISVLSMHDWNRFRDATPVGLAGLPLRGLALMGRFQPKVLAEYARMGFPTVYVDQPNATPGLSHVCVDNEPAAYDATKRLIQLGHRRISFLRFFQVGLKMVDPDSQERERGYRRALADSGIQVSSDMVRNVFARDDEHTPALRGLFRKKNRCTAVFAADAILAQKAAAAAQAEGLQVPRDVSLVCFQGIQPAVNWSGPRIPFKALGQAAVRILLENRGLLYLRVPATWHDGNTLSPAQAYQESSRRRK